MRSRKKLVLFMGIICISIISGLFYCFMINKKVIGFDELKNGDFSALKEIEDNEKRALEIVYQNQKEQKDMEWVISDLNQDGQEELIWRKKNSPSKYMKRIVAIFGKTQGKYKLILLDTVDNTEYYVLENEHMIYCYLSSSTYKYDFYLKCLMNENFDINTDKKLEVFVVYSYGDDDKDSVEYLMEHCPFISGVGNYFRITTYAEDKTNEKIVTQEEWLTEFEELTGTTLEEIDSNLYKSFNLHSF